MNYISVDRALKVAHITLAVIFLGGMASMLAIIALSIKYNWPAYAAVIAAFVAIFIVMAGGFTLAGPRWVAWAYLRVSDVKELERAWQLSGFGAYPIEDHKNEETKRRIKERFDNYRFEDDTSVPYQTEIYFKRPYRNPGVMTGIFFTILLLVPVILGYRDLWFIFLLLVVGAIIIISYNKSSKRSPQITLTPIGIEKDGIRYEWKDISRCDVIQDEDSYLRLTCTGAHTIIKLDDLAVGNRRLNHLLHVYHHRSTGKTIEGRNSLT